LDLTSTDISPKLFTTSVTTHVSTLDVRWHGGSVTMANEVRFDITEWFKRTKDPGFPI